MAIKQKNKSVEEDSGSYLCNEEDVEKTTSEIENGGGGDKRFLKLAVGKNYLLILNKGKYVRNHVHFVGGKKFKCLGDASGGYAPETCPACAKAKEFWELKKAAQKEEHKKIYNDLGKKYGSYLQISMAAVTCEVVKEKIRDKGKDKIITTCAFPENAEPKILNLSQPLWFKLNGGNRRDGKHIAGLKEAFPDIVKSNDDLVNRALLFEKAAGRFGETEIKPFSQALDEIPEFDELPDIDSAVEEIECAEIEELIAKAAAGAVGAGKARQGVDEDVAGTDDEAPVKKGVIAEDDGNNPFDVDTDADEEGTL